MTQISIENLLSQVSECFFNPFLKNKEEIINELKDRNTNCASPFNNGEISIIIFKINNQIIEKLNTLDKKYFFNKSSYQSIENDILNSIKKHPQTENFRNFDVEFVQLGTIGSIIITSLKTQIFCSTNRTNSNDYCDLQLITEGDIICYSQQNLYSIPCIHSGDIMNDYYLFHGIKLEKKETKFDIAIVGYNKKKLNSKEFIKQNPFVVLVDEINNKLIIIPCPLDEATVGNSTLSIMLRCEIKKIDDNYEFSYIIFPKPFCVDNINTGERKYELNEKIKQIDEFMLSRTNETSDILSINDIKIEDTQIIKKEEKINEKSENNYLEFTQYNLNLNKGIIFGSGIGRNEGPPLSILYGTIYGPHALCGMITIDEIDLESYKNDIYSKKIIVNVAPDQFWTPNSCKSKLRSNGLFIIHVIDDILDMKTIDIACAGMSGPQAILIIYHKEKYYYYQGINVPGFTNLSFGDEIDNFDDRKKEWLDAESDIPLIYNSEKPDVYIPESLTYLTGSNILNSKIFLKKIKTIESLVDLEENIQKDLIDVLFQCTIIYNTEQLNEISSKIIDLIFKLVSEKTSLINEQIKYIKSTISTEDINSLIEEFKNKITPLNEEIKNIQLKYKKLNEFLDSIASSNGCFTKQHLIERIKRKNDINKNVSATLEQSNEDFINDLCEATSQNGFMIVNINTIEFINSFKDIENPYILINNEFVKMDQTSFLKIAIEDCRGLYPNKRTPFIDIYTLPALHDVSRNKPNFLDDPKSISLAGFGKDENDRYIEACFAFPLYDLFANLLDPYLDWNVIANNPIIASWRIRLRYMISKSRALNIASENLFLGMKLCLMILNYLEKLIEDRNIPFEENSTLQISFRSLLGLLLSFMASGINSQIKGWEIFSKTFAKITILNSIEEVDILFRLLRLAQYAGWDVTKAWSRTNFIVKKYLVSK